jgi:anti-sigma regulatory factor (Ser/Thr protein kinase)
VASISIALKNNRYELVRLAEAVERFGAEQHLPDDTLTNINLVLDELVSNVIKYSGAGDSEGAISVSLVREGGRLTIEVSDDGIAFNPLEAAPPNLDLPIMERPVGGLGIHIVKALTETTAYRRENERNHLTMTMRAGIGD